jgi:energy-coupling factor transporter transmembrane protein EcfT
LNSAASIDLDNNFKHKTPAKLVFANIYRLFGSVGAAFEITAILTATVLVFLVRKQGLTFYWTLGGSVLLVLAFISWILFVAPMNTEFAQWLTSPVPVDWTRYREQWEYGHALGALINKFAHNFCACGNAKKES